MRLYPRDLQSTANEGAVQAAATLSNASSIERIEADPGVVVSPARIEEGLGALPLLSVLIGAGLLIIAVAGNAARAGQAWAEPLFWIGLAVIVVPVLWRLIGPSAPEHERLCAVVFFGIALYLVKVLHSPWVFTFPDEFVHLRNVQLSIATGRLFEPNSVVPVSALFPGLASAASALTSVSGLTDFASGVLLIGTARVVLLLVLFLTVTRISGSARLAGISTAIYTANPNFVFYSAEYGYESLALPFAALVVYAGLRKWQSGDRTQARSWTAAAMVAMLGLVVTHHVTTYVVLGVLVAVCALTAVRQKQLSRAPWEVLAVGCLAAAGWLLLVASPTLVYLGQILGGALASAVQLVLTHQLGRQPFQSTASGSVTPLVYQILGLASVVFIVVGLPFGLWQVWRFHRRNVFALLLAMGGLAYPPVQLLRLTQFGWETATRSSEFLFVGIGFLLALVVVAVARRMPAGYKRFGAALTVVYLATIFAGGLLVGWRADLLLPRAFVVRGSGPAIEPEGLADARWSRALLGSGKRLAADASNAQYLITYGDQYVLTGDAGGVRSAILGTSVDDSVRYILNQDQLQFVVIDRRLISWNSVVGIYPPRPGADRDQSVLLDPAAIDKFDQQPNVNRIIDSGNIVIYDVGGLSGATNSN